MAPAGRTYTLQIAHPSGLEVAQRRWAKVRLRWAQRSVSSAQAYMARVSRAHG